MALRVLLPLLACLVTGCGSPTSELPRDVEVQVEGVGLDPLTETPVVVLEERSGERTLPIWIGVAEARSIATQMEEMTPPRPNTHDLAKRLLNVLEARVDRVVVTELQGGTYFAILVVRNGPRLLEIDARPSDAIAIALRVQAPLFVREGLFEVRNREEDREEPSEELRL
jgi:bifunctional DNase/RNase